jgi:hypothetical protein
VLKTGYPAVPAASVSSDHAVHLYRSGASARSAGNLGGGGCGSGGRARTGSGHWAAVSGAPNTQGRNQFVRHSTDWF